MASRCVQFRRLSCAGEHCVHAGRGHHLSQGRHRDGRLDLVQPWKVPPPRHKLCRFRLIKSSASDSDPDLIESVDQDLDTRR
jgi:hypothetical protein